MGDHEDILKLEMQIHKLKIDYEQYFAGILKIPPFKLHEEIKQIIRHQSSRKILNTALSFKFKSIVGRYTTYNNLWTRILRQIDDGTFRRGAGMGTQGRAAGADKGAKDSPAEQLYKEYVSAKQSLNQKTDDIKVEKLQAMIEKQTAAIKEKYKVKDVDYKVVTEKGQAKIKAVPRK